MIDLRHSMPLWKLHRQYPDSQSYRVLIGLAAIAASALLTILGGRIDLLGSKVIAELAITACLLWFFAESSNTPFTSKLTATLILSGVAIGVAWIAFIAPSRPAGGFIDWKAHPFIFLLVGYVGATITAPLFEEKVVRGMIFHGLSKYVGPLISSILVSILFALAHSENMLWAFAVSLVLCWMMLKYGLNTYQRAIVHGSINFVIMTWYFFN